MNIGTQLQKKRNEMNYTQEYVAEKIHVSRQTISSWENNRSLPDIMSVMLLSDIYDLSLDDLLKGDQNMMEKIVREEQAKKNQKYLGYSLKGVSFSLLLLSILMILDGVFHTTLITGLLPYFLIGVSLISVVASASFTNLYTKETEQNAIGNILKKSIVLIALGVIVGFICAFFLTKL